MSISVTFMKKLFSAQDAYRDAQRYLMRLYDRQRRRHDPNLDALQGMLDYIIQASLISSAGCDGALSYDEARFIEKICEHADITVRFNKYIKEKKIDLPQLDWATLIELMGSFDDKQQAINFVSFLGGMVLESAEPLLDFLAYVCTDEKDFEATDKLNSCLSIIIGSLVELEGESLEGLAPEELPKTRAGNKFMAGVSMARVIFVDNVRKRVNF